MPIRGTILLTWTLMYGFAALLYLIAFSRRRVEPELSRFGQVCVAFVLIAYARFRLFAAVSTEDVVLAGHMAGVGRYLLGATIVSMCASISHLPTRLVPFASSWAVVGIILVATGAHGGLDEAEEAYEIHAPGRAMYVLGLALAGKALFDAARLRRYDPYVRRVVGAATVCFVAALADAATSSLGSPRFDALAHAGIIGVVMVHWTLLDRFGEATLKLTQRREAYAESLEDLSKKHEQLVETEQLAVVGELSAVIAHEVRNPLAVIKNAASAIRRGHGPEAQRRLLDILDEETERLHKLTFELGAFAEHGKPNLGECDVLTMLEQCASRARAHRATTHSTPAEIEPRSSVSTLVADRELLESALFYLVENAMDASPPGAMIRLEAREAALEGEPAVEFVIVDEGEGMEPEVLEKATTPFFTTRPRGTGLALAIASRIAVNHGGRLVLESERGRGTTARLLLPKRRTSLMPSLPDIPPPPEEHREGAPLS